MEMSPAKKEVILLISFHINQEAGIIFTLSDKPNRMIRTLSSHTTKKLILRFILENIDYRKRCLYLQEIISLSKADEVWLKALAVFFDTPVKNFPNKTFSKN